MGWVGRSALVSSTSSHTRDDTDRGTRHRGPSLLILAVVFAVLFVGSLVVVAAMTHGGHFPSPFGPIAAANAFFADNRDAIRFGAFLQFGASVPLAIFAATASSRLRFLGIEAAGAQIALVGGILASAMGAFSALAQWALAQPDLGTEARALHLLAFATGGPGYVVPFGLLVAGIAVTGGLARKLPRWVMWCGLLVAMASELSSLAIAFTPVAYLLPLARFTGLVWLIVVGAMLPSMRYRAPMRRSTTFTVSSMIERSNATE
jgi:hypothetical protein